jgi:serine protease
MKKIFLWCLFFLGLGYALMSYPSLASKGTYNSIVVDFKDSLPESSITAIAKQYDLHLNSVFSQSDHIYIIKGDRSLLTKLKTDLKNNVEFIEPNYNYQALEMPNDPEYSQQWNLRNINIETAWDENKGEGITVAVIDTGVTQVTDLKETKFVKGYDFIKDKVNADDDNGHGTHVAGTIAQSTNNNYGVAGIAYKSSIMPLKVLDNYGSGNIADIAEAIKFAADNKADIINMSLGGGGDSNLLAEAVNYAYKKGVVVVAAAGNENENSASYPARYPHVISVSAIDSAGQKAPYSNYGAGVDISAPGGSESGGILQETIDPETGKSVFLGLQGTSMASPHVAGVAALIKAEGIKEPDQVLNILKQSARQIKEDPFNYFGAGQLDATSAVKLAVSGQISFKDFFRWLRDNGYLNPTFWFDGGAVALLPKIAMILGSYLLAFLLRNYLPFLASSTLNWGLVMGSSGLFIFKGLYIFDLPQFPLRLLGSSLPELGGAINGSQVLNPVFASVLIPLILVILLLGHDQGKWLAIGSCLGVASCLLVSAVVSPELWGLGDGLLARSFLIVNAILCYKLAELASKKEEQLV